MPEKFDKTSPSFWTEFSSATPSEFPTQFYKAHKHFRIENLQFPSINTQTIKEYFLYDKSTAHKDRRETLVFKCCHFEDFEALNIDATLVFEGCTFEKKVELTSSGKGVRFLHTSFMGDVIIAGSGSRLCQLELIDCSFIKAVKLSNFDFTNEQSQVTGTFPSRFNLIKFKKSLLIIDVTFSKELVFNSVTWPKKIIANRDILRQLKVCMEEQKNVLQANVFHSLEMDEYRKELSWKRPEDWQDLLVFTLNKAISNNTLSWLRPLFLIMVVSYIFYSMVCGWDSIFTCGWNGFFSFMSPLNRTPELYQSVYALWFIHKVVMVVLVYHLVVALKRKTKFG